MNHRMKERRSMRVITRTEKRAIDVLMYLLMRDHTLALALAHDPS